MRWLTFVLAVASSTAFGQSVEMPQAVTAATGRLAAVEMRYDGEDFAYVVPPELDAFREFTTDPNVVKLRVIGYSAGTFPITAVATKCVDGKAKLSPFKLCLVHVGGVPPVPPPRPEPPVPPEPEPPPNPQPAGARNLLIIRESANDTPLQSLMFNGLQAGKQSIELRAKGHACFVLDDDAKGPDGQSSPLVESWRPHFTGMAFPVLIIADKATGKIVHKQSLDAGASADDVMAILKLHGG